MSVSTVASAQAALPPTAAAGATSTGPPLTQTAAGYTVTGTNGVTLSLDPTTLSYTGQVPQNASGSYESIVGHGDFSWTIQSGQNTVQISQQGDVQVSVNGAAPQSIGNISSQTTQQTLAQYVDPTTLQDINTVVQTHDLSKTSFEQQNMSSAGVQELANIQNQISSSVASSMTAAATATSASGVATPAPTSSSYSGYSGYTPAATGTTVNSGISAAA